MRVNPVARLDVSGGQSDRRAVLQNGLTREDRAHSDLVSKRDRASGVYLRDLRPAEDCGTSSGRDCVQSYSNIIVGVDEQHFQQNVEPSFPELKRILPLTLSREISVPESPGSMVEFRKAIYL
jgi:hypothetical protein